MNNTFIKDNYGNFFFFGYYLFLGLIYFNQIEEFRLMDYWLIIFPHLINVIPNFVRTKQLNKL